MPEVPDVSDDEPVDPVVEPVLDSGEDPTIANEPAAGANEATPIGAVGLVGLVLAAALRRRR